MSKPHQPSRAEVIVAFTYAEAAAGFTWGLVWNDLEAPRVDPGLTEIGIGSLFTAIAVYKWKQFIEIRNRI